MKSTMPSNKTKTEDLEHFKFEHSSQIKNKERLLWWAPAAPLNATVCLMTTVRGTASSLNLQEIGPERSANSI